MARPAVTEVRGGRLVASREDYDRLVWKVVYQQECACGCRRSAESAHHLVGRGQGGDDVIENMIPLAGDGTRLCHGAYTHKELTYDLDTGVYISPAGVARGIRRYLDEHAEKRRYIIEQKSEAWLDRMYPKEAS